MRERMEVSSWTSTFAILGKRTAFPSLKWVLGDERSRQILKMMKDRVHPFPARTLQPHYNQNKTSQFIIKIQQFLAPFILLGASVSIRFYTQSSTQTSLADYRRRNKSHKVYNVTNFLDQHPGGDEVLLNTTGKDATQEFDDIGHSHEAWAILEKYYVGELDKTTLTTTNVAPSLKFKDNKGRKKIMIYLLQFLAPLVILNLAIAFFSKSSS